MIFFKHFQRALIYVSVFSYHISVKLDTHHNDLVSFVEKSLDKSVFLSHSSWCSLVACVIAQIKKRKKEITDFQSLQYHPIIPQCLPGINVNKKKKKETIG